MELQLLSAGLCPGVGGGQGLARPYCLHARHTRLPSAELSNQLAVRAILRPALMQTLPSPMRPCHTILPHPHAMFEPRNALQPQVLVANLVALIWNTYMSFQSHKAVAAPQAAVAAAVPAVAAGKKK